MHARRDATNRAAATATAAAVAFAVLGTACREPTQITVRVSTDVPCTDLRGTVVTAGVLGALAGAGARGETDRCDPETGRLGTLVVVPSGGRDEQVAVEVVAGFGRDVADCEGSYGPGCIVARRALRFLPHQSLTLPVTLRAACAGIACLSTETCRNGGCVDAHVDAKACADADGCGEDSLAPDPLRIAGCGDTAGLDPDAPWPMPGFCPTRQGLAPHRALSDVRLDWKITTGRGAVPVLGASGLVYVPGDEAFHAVDAETGVERWSVPTGAVTGPGVLGADRTLFFAVADGTVRAVSSETGAARWTYASGDLEEPRALVHGANGLIYFRENGSDSVTAVNTRDGTLAWTALRGLVSGGPTLGTDGAVIVTGTSDVSALDPGTGAVVWNVGTFSTNGVGFTDPVATRDGAVYVTSHRGQLSRLDGRTGAVRWQRTVSPGDQNASPAIGPDGTVYLGTTGNEVLAIHPDDGRTLWTVSRTDRVHTPVVDAAGVVLVTGFDYALTAIDGVTGTVAWTLPLEADAPDDPPSIGADGSLYVQSRLGRLARVTR